MKVNVLMNVVMIIFINIIIKINAIKNVRKELLLMKLIIHVMTLKISKQLLLIRLMRKKWVQLLLQL